MRADESNTQSQFLDSVSTMQLIYLYTRTKCIQKVHKIRENESNER